jgi:multiple sugar transport system ATP-binding protein
MGKGVIFGIRPEHIQDRKYCVDPIMDNCVSAMVDVVEPMGSDVILHLTIGQASLVARVNPKTSARKDSIIGVHIDMDRVHIFDKETGRVIQ